MKHCLMSFASISVLMFVSNSASAQWIYQANESDFGDTGVYVAISAVENYGLGLRCDGDGANIVYFTPEKMNTDEVATLNAIKVVLKLRSDKGEVTEIPVGALSQDDKLMLKGIASNELITIMKNSKKSISVALSFIGKNVHEAKFNSTSISKSIDSLQKGCKL